MLEGQVGLAVVLGSLRGESVAQRSILGSLFWPSGVAVGKPITSKENAEPKLHRSDDCSRWQIATDFLTRSPKNPFILAIAIAGATHGNTVDAIDAKLGLPPAQIGT